MNDVVKGWVGMDSRPRALEFLGGVKKRLSGKVTCACKVIESDANAVSGIIKGKGAQPLGGHVGRGAGHGTGV